MQVLTEVMACDFMQPPVSGRCPDPEVRSGAWIIHYFNEDSHDESGWSLPEAESGEVEIRPGEVWGHLFFSRSNELNPPPVQRDESAEAQMRWWWGRWRSTNISSSHKTKRQRQRCFSQTGDSRQWRRAAVPPERWDKPMKRADVSIDGSTPWQQEMKSDHVLKRTRGNDTTPPEAKLTSERANDYSSSSNSDLIKRKKHWTE